MKIQETIFDSFKWVDIEAPHLEELSEIIHQYSLSNYLIKDSLEKGHLPKYEQVGNIDFFIFRAYTSDVNLNIDEVREMSNKIAFFILEDTLFTIHRTAFDFLNMGESKQITIKDFFLKIVGLMLDTFNKPTIDLSNKITNLEKIIFLRDYRVIPIEELYYIKSQSRILKKVLQITQSVLDQVQDKYGHSSLFQDLKDHLLHQLMANEESVENANQLMTTYLSISNQKNNEVVRLLTIFSAFFLPLTFIVGVYGMNFDFMPELKWKLGYYYAIGFMAFIVLIIYLWFRRKKIV